MALRTAWPVLRHREPARCRHQYRHRGGRECAGRRVYPAAGRSAHATNATLYKLNFNFIRDIAPVAGIICVANVIVVHPSVPAKTVAEFIAYAKANPGKINMATNGNGSGSYMPGELFKMMTGVDMVHVPYRGTGPAVTDPLGGQVQVMFGSMPALIEYIKAGTLRALAVTTAMRSEVPPDIPTVGEFVSGYEASSFYGIGVPKNTPAEIVDKLNREINVALADHEMQARLADLGGTALLGSPGDFGMLIAEETEKWGKVIRRGRCAGLLDLLLLAGPTSSRA